MEIKNSGNPAVFYFYENLHELVKKACPHSFNLLITFNSLSSDSLLESSVMLYKEHSRLKLL